MAHKKITAFASAVSAQAGTLYPVVSGGNANKTITQHTMLKSFGVPQYVEGTCRATATVAFLPGPVNIFDIYVKPLVGSSATNAGSDVEIGIGTNSQLFATISTSGLSMVRATRLNFGNASSLQQVSGAIVAAAISATVASNFIVGIGYFRT